MIQFRFFFILYLFFFAGFIVLAQTPDSFISHKVRKGETIDFLIAKYGITKPQLKEYNPSIESLGIRKKMNLRIPVFQLKKPPIITTSISRPSLEYIIHKVAPKENKWRLSKYRYPHSHG